MLASGAIEETICLSWVGSMGHRSSVCVPKAVREEMGRRRSKNGTGQKEICLGTECGHRGPGLQPRCDLRGPISWIGMLLALQHPKAAKTLAEARLL